MRLTTSFRVQCCFRRFGERYRDNVPWQSVLGHGTSGIVLGSLDIKERQSLQGIHIGATYLIGMNNVLHCGSLFSRIQVIADDTDKD
jgi:hypothetical protein